MHYYTLLIILYFFFLFTPATNRFAITQDTDPLQRYFMMVLTIKIATVVLGYLATGAVAYGNGTQPILPQATQLANVTGVAAGVRGTNQSFISLGYPVIPKCAVCLIFFSFYLVFFFQFLPSNNQV
jgi:hypothetical protein